jgi:hemerythrin-like metal-binding protein
MEKLEKIIWSDELSIGNTDIDIDHKRLVDIYNELIDYVVSKDNREEFAMILSKMTEYCLDHFKKEEKYMQKMSYPKLSEHKKLHKDFSYKVAMYNIDLLVGDPHEIKNIIKYLNKWWIDHVLNTDKKYEDYKKEIHSDVKY